MKETIFVPKSKQQKLIEENETRWVQSNQGMSQGDQCEIEQLSKDSIYL